ncbi:MAG: hotdog fold thioesterase [Bacteroidales bacterium]|jgi:1,4-dihydroxy-2-naphthoyl-CoA hydrolase
MTLEEMNALIAGTLMESLGIIFTEYREGYICATMPVDARTKQPAGLLHGGASAALAESLGSMGSLALIDREKQSIVGIEINASHVRKVSEGFVTGQAELIARSTKLHVWQIRIIDEKSRLVCLSRLSVMVIDKKH